MINNLNIKCPNYHQCKYRGTVRTLVEQHEKTCFKKNINKKSSGSKAKECPLKHIGCIDFNGGYGNLHQHYNEYQQQHLQYIINYFDTKFHKFEKNFTQKLNTAEIKINTLQQ